MKTSEYNILEEAKKEKSVENPKIRWKDPACWKCLSNEQRDIICEWYYDFLIKDEKEQRRKNNLTYNAGYFALMPLAFSYALPRYEDLSISFIVESVSAWIIFSIVYYLFSSGFENLFKNSEEKTPVEKAIFIVLYVFLSYFIPACCFSVVT